MGLSHQQSLVPCGHHRRSPAPLVRARRARGFVGRLRHRARGPLCPVYPALPPAVGGGRAVRPHLWSGAVAARHAHRGGPRCRCICIRRPARGDGGGCAARRIHPWSRRRASGGASCRRGGCHLRYGGHCRWPRPRGLAGSRRAVHRRNRLGVDAGDSQRHRPATGPGVGEGPGGVALHAGLCRRPSVGSTLGGCHRGGVRDTGRICRPWVGHRRARSGAPQPPAPPPWIGGDPRTARRIGPCPSTPITSRVGR